MLDRVKSSHYAEREHRYSRHVDSCNDLFQSRTVAIEKSLSWVFSVHYIREITPSSHEQHKTERTHGDPQWTVVNLLVEMAFHNERNCY